MTTQILLTEAYTIDLPATIKEMTFDMNLFIALSGAQAIAKEVDPPLLQIQIFAPRPFRFEMLIAMNGILTVDPTLSTAQLRARQPWRTRLARAMEANREDQQASYKQSGHGGASSNYGGQARARQRTRTNLDLPNSAVRKDTGGLTIEGEHNIQPTTQ